MDVHFTCCLARPRPFDMIFYSADDAVPLPTVSLLWMVGLESPDREKEIDKPPEK